MLVFIPPKDQTITQTARQVAAQRTHLLLLLAGGSNPSRVANHKSN
jgi:hypothetical protein